MAGGDGEGSDRSGTSRFSLVRACSSSLCYVFLSVLLIIGIGRGFLVDKALLGPDIRVVSLSVRNFSVSDSQLIGRFLVGFNMSNPNEKTDMSAGEFRVSICHREVELARVRGQKKQGSIALERTTEKNLKVSLVVKKAAEDSPKLRKKKVFEKMEEEWSRRVVNFDLRMQVTVRFQAGDSPPKSKLLNLACDHLAVFFFGKHRVAGRLVGVGDATYDCRINRSAFTSHGEP